MTVGVGILQEVVLLRIRGFLHAFHLVEMTTVGTKRLYTLSPQQNSPKRILFHLLGKISSTEWISSVKDGFRCVALLRLRGFLHAFHLVEMTTGMNDLSGGFFGFFNPLNDSKVGYFTRGSTASP